MKIAVVYDWLNQFGGAERVLETIFDIWPEAKLFTSVYSKERTSLKFKEAKATFIQKFPGGESRPFLYYPLLPVAFEQFNLDKFDIVISVSSGPAKAIITKPETFHLCYCLTPPRYFWEKQFLPHKKFFSFLSPLRAQDYFLSKRPDAFFAISKNIQQKIKKIYHRDAEVIYPGIDLKKFKPREKNGNFKKPYFLLVSRLVEYKKIDLAIKAFNQTKFKLIIVGCGRQMDYLKSIAAQNIHFYGKASDENLINLYQNCQALICPQEEDFGLAPIESQACGKPVISFSKGGIKETVIPGKTGEFFFPQTPEALLQTLKKFNPSKYHSDDCIRNAQKFDQKNFMILFKKKTEEKWQKYRQKFM